MRQGAVHAPASQRVRIALGEIADFLIADIAGPYASVGEEETLFWRETVLCGQRGILRGVLKGLEGDLQTTMVSHVLAEGELAVGLETGQHLDVVEEVAHDMSTFLEVLCILGRPPLAQVAVLIELGTLVVEAVCHLMTDDHADGTVVESIVGVHIEEGRLQDTCGEADLIGRGIVVGVDRLWCHVPHGVIHGLVESALHLVEVLPGSHVLDVGPVVAANLEFAVVFPFIGVTHFDDEGVEFVVGHGLCGVRHPFLCVDALAEGYLQVAHELRHAFLGCCGEVFLDIELSDSLAQCTFCGADGTFPARTVLLAAAHHLAIEGEGLCAHGIVEIAGGCIDELPADVVLQRLQRSVTPDGFHLLHELRLSHA